MKLASGFCIPEPLPVHTGRKGQQLRPLTEKCADLHKPFISYLFLVGITVRSAECLSSAIPQGTSTKTANSKRANHGRSCLFQDAVSSVSFWLWSFPVCGWRTRLLSSVFGQTNRKYLKPSFTEVWNPFRFPWGKEQLAISSSDVLSGPGGHQG